MNINTETCTEEEARDAFVKMSRRFGWAGTFFRRGDVLVEVEGDIDYDSPITDVEWEVLRQHPLMWEDGIVAQMTYDIDIPMVVRQDNGDFVVVDAMSTTGFYTKDGHKKEEGK